MLDSEMPSVQNASSVERALQILECLDSSRRGLNISEISRKLNIPKSSAHVIIVTLQRLGYVQKREESLNYMLGLKAYGLVQEEVARHPAHRPLNPFAHTGSGGSPSPPGSSRSCRS